MVRRYLLLSLVFILCAFFFSISCILPRDGVGEITVEEFFKLEVVACYEVNSTMHLHYFLHPDSPVIAMVYMRGPAVIRYAYLNSEGQLVGFVLDMEASGEELVYVPEIISDEDSEWILRDLLRMRDGLKPVPPGAQYVRVWG